MKPKFKWDYQKKIKLEIKDNEGKSNMWYRSFIHESGDDVSFVDGLVSQKYQFVFGKV